MCGCFVVLGQIVVFITNLVVMLLGGLITGAGVFIKYIVDSSLEALKIENLPNASDLKIVIIPLIVAGVVLFVFGITGCIGATCKVICCLILLECCGVNGTDSYVAAGFPIPPTCCTNTTDTIDVVAIASDLADLPNINITCHSVGCGTVISNYFVEYGSIVKIILIVIVCIEIATIGFDMLIACSKKKK